MKRFLFTVVILLATFVRFVRLDQVPPSLYYDEIDLGYQVRSLLETGRDYRSQKSPFYFRSFNTDKTPLPILLSATVSKLFHSPEYQVRSGTALVGVGVVILAMILALQITNSPLTAVIAGLVFATSPWQIHFSRLAFEAEFALFFLFLYLSLFFHWQKSRSKLSFFASAVTLGFSVYTYRTMSLFSPLVLVLTLAIFYKDFNKIGFAKTSIWLFISLGLIVPFLYATTIASADQPRINQISIFSDPLVPIMVQRHREVDSGDYQSKEVGRGATLKSKIFFNKLVSIAEKYRDNTFQNFSPSFLFLSGDPNGRHSAKDSGELLFVDILGLVVGGYLVFKNLKDRRYLYLVILLFLGAVPANLTMDGANHASRLITFSGPLLLVVALGYSQIFETLNKKILPKIILIILIGAWLFAGLEFFNKYLYHFPVENHREFGYGYKQVTEKIEELKGNFDKVYITDKNDPPMLYYLFWANVPPKTLQEYGTEFGDEIIKGVSLDKIKPTHFDFAFCEIKGIESLQSNTLYVVAYNDLPLDFRAPDKDPVPQGIKLIDLVLYPNNEPAYYLITRDTKGGKPISPLKTQKCK